MKQFHISKIEVDRRKKAFTALLISFFIFSILFSVDLIVENIAMSIIGILFFVLILFVFRVMTFNYLNNLLKTKLIFTDDYLVKNWNKTEEKCNFREIKYIKIKKTSKGYNREISIFTKKSNDMIINGLDDFNDFEQELRNKIDNKKIKSVKELFDFDHPFFYPILGMLLSFLFIYGIKILADLNYNNIKLFYYSILIYNFLLCIYFFITKPLSKTLEKKKVNPDYIFILFIICTSVLIYFFMF